jgi:DNA-binding response OmpR family regulator
MSRKRILVVEDDAASRNVLTLRLKGAGFEPIPVADATSALVTARKQSPDLVILDLGLPGGGGFSVLERLRAMPQLSTIPVVVVSAYNREVNEAKALEAGASAYFQKPADHEELMATIRNLLNDTSA